MKEVIAVLILFYSIITSTLGAIFTAGDCRISDNKMIALFLVGALFGWIIIPVRIILGFKEIIHDWKFKHELIQEYKEQ